MYFSSVSENTHRFVQRLAAGRPDSAARGRIRVDEPYVLMLPTYGGGSATPDIDAGGFVPKQVIAFLNDEHNRALIRGVIAAGNTNFGAEFALRRRRDLAQMRVPYLYRFELMGTHEDVERVREGLGFFGNRRATNRHNCGRSARPARRIRRARRITTRSTRC